MRLRRACTARIRAVAARRRRSSACLAAALARFCFLRRLLLAMMAPDATAQGTQVVRDYERSTAASWRHTPSAVGPARVKQACLTVMLDVQRARRAGRGALPAFP